MTIVYHHIELREAESTGSLVSIRDSAMWRSVYFVPGPFSFFYRELVPHHQHLPFPRDSTLQI
jgi:hypothetical protein